MLSSREMDCEFNLEWKLIPLPCAPVGKARQGAAGRRRGVGEKSGESEKEMDRERKQSSGNE